MVRRLRSKGTFAQKVGIVDASIEQAPQQRNIHEDSAKVKGRVLWCLRAVRKLNVLKHQQVIFSARGVQTRAAIVRIGL